MDTEISEASPAGQNSRPPEAAIVRSVPDEPMVDRRDQRSGGPRACADPDQSAEQRGGSDPNIEGRDVSGDPEGIPGVGRVPVGRQFLGGRLFCRDNRPS